MIKRPLRNLTALTFEEISVTFDLFRSRLPRGHCIISTTLIIEKIDAGYDPSNSPWVKDRHTEGQASSHRKQTIIFDTCK
jgi:hypothetical protein